jgi:2-polyprenyl-3-methyl-5-hydroxy-6-metoxy-1,4-benzoquinol methylase
MGGGYSPLRGAVRTLRPTWAARLTPAGRAIARFVDARGLTVLHGPFEGLMYPPAARGHADFLGSKVLGAYELELNDPIERILASGVVRQVVDVGAGDGFYVVGLARRIAAGVSVLGFELNAGERRICSEMARINGVDDRIRVEGFCDPGRLRETLASGALLVCDCEGFEDELLRPDLVPQLANATVIVELHPHVAPGIEETLAGRFGPTHRIGPRLRDAREWPELEGMTERDAYLVLSEGWLSDEEWGDSGRSWLVLEPRSTSVQAGEPAGWSTGKGTIPCPVADASSQAGSFRERVGGGAIRRILARHPFVRLFGWYGLLAHGDPSMVGRWMWIRRKLAAGPDVSTCDAGCGSGLFTLYAAKRGNSVVGISFDDENNHKATERAAVLNLRDRARFVTGDLRDLDRFGPDLGTFDQVICMETIEHIIDSHKVARDLASITRVGGRLLLTTPALDHSPNVFGTEISEVEDGRHVVYGYSHEQLREILGDAGFEITDAGYAVGPVCQLVIYTMWKLSRISTVLAWALTLPLRPLALLDTFAERFTRFPNYCVAVVAERRAAESS